MRYPGGIVSATPIVPAQAGASGFWRLPEVLQARSQNTWPIIAPPSWVLSADGQLASRYADFTTEGGTPHYWYNNNSYGNFASLRADDGSTFAASSVRYYYNASGILTAASSGIPRFDYDPATLAAKGLLLEGGATNILPASNNFTNATYWAGGGAAYGGTTTGPDGVSNSLVLFLPNAGAGNHYANNNTSGAGGSLPWSYSKIAKAGGYHWLYLSPIGADAAGVWFDLQNGVVGTVSAGHTGFIQDLGNGSYRCTAIKTVGVGFMFAQYSGTTGDGVGISFTADGVSGDYVGFAQLEQSAFPTSFIPTTTTSAARQADSLSRPRTSPTTLAKLLSARTPPGVASEQILWSADDGSANNRLRATYKSDGHLHVIVTTGGVDQCDLDMGAVAVNTTFKLAFRLAANDFAASLNGGTIVADGAGTMPSGVVNDRLGSGLTAGTEWFSTVKLESDWATASNSALQSLST